MKNSIKLFAITLVHVLIFTFADNAAAQVQISKETIKETNASNTQNFGMLVRTEEHIKASVKTASELLKGDKFKTNHIEIIICGEAVELLKKGSLIEDVLKKAIDMKVRIVACGMSMEKQNISKESLLSGVEMESNGIIRIFELQSQGYKTVEL